jgi:hypothetical protein
LNYIRTLFRAFFPLSSHVVAFAGELRPSAKRALIISGLSGISGLTGAALVCQLLSPKSIRHHENAGTLGRSGLRGDEWGSSQKRDGLRPDKTMRANPHIAVRPIHVFF